MRISTLSSREFNQDTSRAKKVANNGPVYITDRGRATHVLLTIEKFESLSGQGRQIVDILAVQNDVEIELEPPRFAGLVHAVDLS